ncbi:hypothetical protein ACTXT7_006538 [Hymenolepis weldensis]
MTGGYVRGDPTEVPTGMRMKFPPTVMVFGVVKGSESHITTPQVFHRAIESMQMFISRLFKPFLLSHLADNAANAGRPPNVFQQDSPPSHKALNTQNWMGENFHHHEIISAEMKDRETSP